MKQGHDALKLLMKLKVGLLKAGSQPRPQLQVLGRVKVMTWHRDHNVGVPNLGINSPSLSFLYYHDRVAVILAPCKHSHFKLEWPYGESPDSSDPTRSNRGTILTVTLRKLFYLFFSIWTKAQSLTHAKCSLIIISFSHHGCARLLRGQGSGASMESCLSPSRRNINKPALHHPRISVIKALSILTLICINIRTDPKPFLAASVIHLSMTFKYHFLQWQSRV